MSASGAARGPAALDCAGQPSSANGREPPHDLPVEAAVLASMLLSVDGARLVLAGPLRAEHFYSPAHRHIFTAVQDLVAAESSVDVLVVESLTGSSSTWSAGRATWTNWFRQHPPPSTSRRMPRSSSRSGQLRRAITTHLTIVAQGYGEVGDVNEYLDGAARAIAEQQEAPRIEGGIVLGVRPLDVDELFAPLPPVDSRAQAPRAGRGSRSRPDLVEEHGEGAASPVVAMQCRRRRSS